MQSLDLLSAAVRRQQVVRRVGRIKSLGSNSIDVTGLSDVVGLGHRVVLGADEGLRGEIVHVSPDVVTVLADGDMSRLGIGQPVRHAGRHELFPEESWLGRVIDPDGQPLDGRVLVQGATAMRLDGAPPPAVSRRAMGPRLSTGYALFNTMLPIVRGQRMGIFSGSGVGKSSLMATFARDMDAEVVVIALIGERGREVNHFVKHVLGQKGLRRSIVVAATSDQSALSRRRAAFSAMAIAEYFRNMGRQVLLLLDSITRLAEAHREIASASGEALSMRGFPASMTGLLAGFAERAGPGAEGQGDITAIFTVLVSGSDMEEPVADTLRGLLDGHVVLSRDIAERGRFPAVDVLQSVSRSLPDAATEEENVVIADARRTMSVYEESEIMVRSGLHQRGGNPGLDRAISLHSALDAFASARDSSIAASFDRLRDCLVSETQQETRQSEHLSD